MSNYLCWLLEELSVQTGMFISANLDQTISNSIMIQLGKIRNAIT